MTDLPDLLFMRARYYMPSVGRFINKDPIGLAGGVNLYNYVFANPVNEIAPLGLFPGLGIGCKIVGKVIIGFTKHGLNRIIQRKILPAIILDTLRNPQSIIKIIDEAGRSSFQYIGDNEIIIINEFGQIITGWLRKKL